MHTLTYRRITDCVNMVQRLKVVASMDKQLTKELFLEVLTIV